MDEFFDRVKILWEMFMSYLYGIGRDWRENRKPRAVGKIVLPLIPVALICALLAFLWRIREAIVKAVGGILFVLIIVYMCKQGKPKDNQPGKKSDTVIMKHAIQGRDNLLDIILVVGESLEKQLTGIYMIQCPKSRGQLAYPHINRCITVKDGVASVAVAFPYTGEADKDHFKERFNDRMCQMLNAYEVPGHPDPVFSDKDNVPHSSIQAIRADIVGDRLILEVIRVTQEAIPLLNELDRAEGDRTNDQGALYDDEL